MVPAACYWNQGAHPSVTDTDLVQKLRTRSAKIAVVGLRHAGLPMAVECARAGFACVGLDVDQSRVDAVTQGGSAVADVDDADLGFLRTDARLEASKNAAVPDSADVAIICVPDPLTSSGGPDLRVVETVGGTIAELLPP